MIWILIPATLTDFEKLEALLALYNNLIEVSLTTQPSEFQLDFCKLQNVQLLLSKKHEKPDNFWKLVSQERFLLLWDESLKLFSMFESTAFYGPLGALWYKAQYQKTDANALLSLHKALQIRIILTCFLRDLNCWY